MAISFDCSCGKHFTVKDEFAGKRTKCPACGGALTVPSAPADEDEAFRMLEAAEVADEPARPPRRDWDGQVEPTQSAPTPPPVAGPVPKPAPNPAPAKRGPTYQPREETESGGFRISLSQAVAGGLASMAVAGIWFGVGLAADRIYLYPPILFFLGLVAVVKGVLGHPEE